MRAGYVGRMGPPNSGQGGVSVDFTISTSLPSWLAITRSSTALYFDSTPELATAAIDVPRFDHNPVTDAPRGLLVEGGATNGTYYSADTSGTTFNSSYVNSAVWLVKGGTHTVGTDAKFPDMDILEFTEDTSTGEHVLGAPLGAAVDALDYCHSVVVKGNIKIAFTNKNGFFTSNDGHVKIDLATGEIFGNINRPVNGIEDLGDGWYRVYLSALASAGSGFRTCAVQTLNPANDRTDSFAGTGRTFKMAIPQRELGTFPTSYIPTTSNAAVTRAPESLTCTDLSQINFNPNRGTFTIKFRPAAVPPASEFWGLISFDDETTDNRITALYRHTTGDVRCDIFEGGVQQNVGTTAGTLAAGEVGTFTVSYAENYLAYQLNGGTVITDDSIALPTVTRAILGRLGSLGGSSHFFGEILDCEYSSDLRI